MAPSVRRSVLSLVVVLLLPPSALAVSRSVPLGQAVKRRLVQARGVDPDSYRRVTLELGNRSDRHLCVDLGGAFLRPTDGGSCQRLGLGPLAGKTPRTRQRRGSVLVNLRPREVRRFTVRTVCLDAGRAAPTDQVFEAATAPIPEPRNSVLRWWVDHPETAQALVNEAIWQVRDHVRVEAGVSPPYVTPVGRDAAALGGVYYMLNDGELTSIGPDGYRRFLGTCIFRIFPTTRGLFAVGLGAGGEPELWVHEQTGERPWRYIAGIEKDRRLLDVLSVPVDRRGWLRSLPDGTHRVPGLLLVTPRGLWTVERRPMRSRALPGVTEARELSVRPTGRGRLRLAIRWSADEGEKPRPEMPRLGELDLVTGDVSWDYGCWNVSRVVLGPSGAFGLTEAGLLKRGVSIPSVRHGSGVRCDRIFAVGRRVVWVRLKDGALATVDARTARVQRVADLKLEDETPFRVDPITDDLVFAAGVRFVRVRATDASVETVR